MTDRKSPATSTEEARGLQIRKEDYEPPRVVLLGDFVHITQDSGKEPSPLDAEILGWGS